MIPQLLPPDRRALNRRRWSFRLSGLTTLTVAAVEAWKLTPDEWHPMLPAWGKYAVMGVVMALALLAPAAHLFKQESAEPQSADPSEASK